MGVSLRISFYRRGGIRAYPEYKPNAIKCDYRT